MFNSLQGIITSKLPQKIYLDTHGIEWDITVSDTTLDKLPSVGSEVRVYVWMQHTDSLMSLYGFASENDRILFFDLLKVDGIGPKAAIKIMSNITTGELAAVLDNGDLARLEKVPGVGKKTAAKMLLQLKGKLSLEETVVVSKKSAIPFSDVVAALTAMGYDKKMSEEAVVKISDSLKDDSQFNSLSQSQKEDTVFKKAIVELAQ